MKLKIALNLKAEDILEYMELASFRLSKHELSAFFRKPGHKHYRECKDQVLRNFLKGMQLKYRENVGFDDTPSEPSQPKNAQPKEAAPKTSFKWNPLPSAGAASDEDE